MQDTDQIARLAMARVKMVTDPTLTQAQKELMYEIHMPDDSSGHRQTYDNSRHDGIQAAPVRREILNGHIVDFI